MRDANAVMPHPRTVASKGHFLLCLQLLSLIFGRLPAVSTARQQIRCLDGDNGQDSHECLDGTGVPCKTLHYALSQQPLHNTELRVRPGTYNFTNHTELMLKNPENFTLRVYPDDRGEAVFHCRNYTDTKDYNNMGIIGGSNVKIKGITVENCGPYSAGIYVESVRDIIVTKCTFRENRGGGLWLMNSAKVLVEHCNFTNNTGTQPDPEDSPSPSDVSSHNSGGLVLSYTDFTGAEAEVNHCIFDNNNAYPNTSDVNDPFYAPFGHGGGLVVRLLNSSNTKIEISNSIFRNNMALYSGGAMYVVLMRHPSNNSLIIRNSSFEDCSARTGGGLSVQVFDVEENNLVEIEDSNFTSCSSKEGGGALSLVVVDSQASTSRPAHSNPTLLTVNSTHFQDNYSPTGGSAVGLVSNARVDQPLFVASFRDCNFTGNKAEMQGAFLMFRFPIQLLGYTLFSKNEGGAMLVYQSKVDTRGTLEFKNNSAPSGSGGAVTLEDLSWFNLFEGSKVVFHNNSAKFMGGALLVNNPTVAQDVDPVFNSNCFFQYGPDKSKPPDKWNVTVTFTNNTAMTAGAAIFASTLSVCMFTSTMCEDGTENASIYERSIFSGEPFMLKGMGNNLTNKSTPEEIQEVATEPSYLNITPGEQNRAPGDMVNITLQALNQSGNNTREEQNRAPGDMVNITLQALDQSGNTREASAMWRIRNDPKTFTYFNIPSSSPYSFPGTFEVAEASQNQCASWTEEPMLTGNKETYNFFIIEEFTGEVVFTKTVNFSVTCCHPGYDYSPETKTCSFAQFPHILRPEQSNKYVYLKPGYYAGFYPDHHRNETYFTTSLMPESFQDCTEDGNRLGCLYKYDSPDEQCKENRTGFMCGTCPGNQSVDLTLRSCKECEPTDTVLLALVCVLVIVGSLLVTMFNIGVPNDLRGFLFFAQVVGYVYRHGAAEDSLSWDFHLSRLLGFSVYLPLCPFTQLSALWTAAFGLLPCLLAIFTITLYILCARVIKPLAQRTVFRGIWLIILFVYKYIADTVSNILNCVALNGDEVKSRYSLKLVFFYDGSVPCYSGEHLGFAIPALFLLVFVVLLGPAFIILISFKRYKRTQAFTDVITDGVKLKMRWWGGFDLLRRLMFIVTITVLDFTRPDYSQLSLCLVSVVVLGILCVSKPYTHSLTNIIEAAILLDLLLVAFIFLNTKESALVNPAIFQILLLLPYLYAITNITIKIIIALWRKYSASRNHTVTTTTLQRKLTSLLKPTKSKFQKHGLLLKTDSVDQPVGEEMEGRHYTQYIPYREELLDSNL